MLDSDSKLNRARSLAQTLADAALAEHYPVHVRDTAEMIIWLIDQTIDTR